MRYFCPLLFFFFSRCIIIILSMLSVCLCVQIHFGREKTQYMNQKYPGPGFFFFFLNKKYIFSIIFYILYYFFLFPRGKMICKVPGSPSCPSYPQLSQLSPVVHIKQKIVRKKKRFHNVTSHGHDLIAMTRIESSGRQGFSQFEGHLFFFSFLFYIWKIKNLVYLIQEKRATAELFADT